MSCAPRELGEPHISRTRPPAPRTQQLAVSTTETVARFRKVETDMTSRIRALETHVAEGFQEMRSAAEDLAKVQQAALDQLLDLVA